MSLRSTLLDWLRVPHAPSAPEGDRDVQIFRAAPNYFWYRAAGWFLKNCAALFGLWLALGFAAALPTIIPERFDVWGITVTERVLMLLIGVVEFGAVAGFLAQAIGSLVLLRLDFEQRWYIVSDRSLRIREGLVQLREQTVTFANVQHVSIRQNPLQRVLGIAELQVRTAGGKGGETEHGEKKEDLHVARFRGIANPEVVREAIKARLRQHRDAGLGDPDDATAATPYLLSAARELAEEARALRIADRGSRIEDHGSRITDHGSRIADRGSRIADH